MTESGTHCISRNRLIDTKIDNSLNLSQIFPGFHGPTEECFLKQCKKRRKRR